MENDIFYLPIPDDWFRWLFWMTVLDDCFGCLFQMSFLDDCSRWLFRMTILDAYFRRLFQMTVLDDYSGRLFQMTFPDDCFGWLILIQRLIHILATNLYFHGRFLFQPIIWLIGPTTDSFLNHGFLLQNYGPDPPWYTATFRSGQLKIRFGTFLSPSLTQFIISNGINFCTGLFNKNVESFFLLYARNTAERISLSLPTITCSTFLLLQLLRGWFYHVVSWNYNANRNNM